MPITGSKEAWASGMGDTDPANNLRAVTKSDTDDMTTFSRALYIGTAGDVALIASADSAAVTLVGVPAGTVLPISAKRVMSTGTTADDIVALY